MPVLRKSTTTAQKQPAAATGSRSSALPPIQPVGRSRKAARTPTAAVAAGASSDSAFSAPGAGRRTAAASADRSTRGRHDVSSKPPLSSSTTSATTTSKRATTTTFAPSKDPFERSAKDRWSSGLGNALAAVRTKDEVQRVTKKEFPLPPVPFGPTTPFRRVRALLGDSQPHLTDPVVAQRHQQQQRDAAAAAKAGSPPPASAGRAHHRPPAGGKETSSDEGGSGGGDSTEDEEDDDEDDGLGMSTSMDLSSLVPGGAAGAGGEGLSRKQSGTFGGGDHGLPSALKLSTGTSSRYIESRSVARRRRRRAAAEGGRGTALPSGLEVAAMPVELGDGIRSVAVSRLAQLFYPRLLLRRARRRLAADTSAAQRHAAKVTGDLLKREALFGDWPAEALTRLIGGLKFSCSRDPRQLLYVGEPAGSLIVFVTSGTVEYVAPRASDNNNNTDSFAARLMTPSTGRPARNKTGDASSAVVLKRFHAPAVVNEFTFLTWEPRLSTVRVGPRAEVWSLDRHAFNAALASLPKEIGAAVNERARAKRLRDVMRLFPLTPAALGRHGALSECSPAFLAALCNIMRPMCVGPGHFFSASDLHDLPPGVPQPSALSLVLRGTVGQFRLLASASGGGSFSMNAGGGASRRMSMMLRRGSNAARSPNSNAAASTLPTSETAKHRPDAVLISERCAPLVLNEHLALLRSPAPVAGEVFEAVSACDGYCADADAVERLLANHPSDRAAVASHSQRQQQKIATAQMAQHRALLARIPFIGFRLGPDALRALSLLFEARVYAPLAVICSSSQQADRVMILTKGTATVEHPGQPKQQQQRRRRRWVRHEAIGYTCVTPHRWAASVVAVETCEVIELPRPALIAFLRDTGLFNDAVAAAKSLMFPNAVVAPSPPTAETEAAADVARAEEARRQTPAMYPVFDDADDFCATRAGLVPAASGDHAPTTVMGGLSAGVLPTAHRLSRGERDAIEADVVARYRPGNARHTVKVTDFLYVKHRTD